MRLKFDFNEQVAGLSFTRRARTLAGQSNMLTGQNALGHLNVEHTLFGHQSAVGIDFRDTQGELPGAAVQRGIEIEQHSRVMVFTVLGVKCAAPSTCSRACSRAEQRFEEVAVVRIAGARTAELKAGTPIRRRAK